MNISAIVKLSPGFASAVDVEGGIANDAKTKRFIPTEVASEILLDMGENLHVSASRRSRLITGTYGTGKSHLALVLARLYRDGASPCLAPVLEKLTNHWPGKAEKLTTERALLPGKFLLVLLTGDQPGTFNDALLLALDGALRRDGLEDILPDTAFKAARMRIEELRKSYKDTYTALQSATKEYGFESVAVLEGQLKQMRKDAYDKFREIHKVVCAGAPFMSYQGMLPYEVYGTVAQKLVEDKGYAGITVIWDEFGRYMERVVENPRGIDGQSIQDFAQKGCNSSHKNQLHLYLICHRSLQEYVNVSAMARTTGMSKLEQDEWNKISGRFREFNMKSTDHEVFQLIDQVLLQEQDKPAWQNLLKDHRDYFDEMTDLAVRLRLFPEFRREDVHSVVTLGAYPLHPMAAFCLPKMSQQVAQNERTMFGFLSDSGSDTLGPFIRNTPVLDRSGKPSCFSADQLWDFFSRNVEESQEHRRTWARFGQAISQIDVDDPFESRIIRTMAILMIIRSEHAPSTEDVLRYAMGLPMSVAQRLRDTLKRLCSKEGKRGKVLHQNADGTYRFATIGVGDLLEDKIDKTVKERINLTGPGEHLRRIWASLGADSAIPATSYSDDFLVERKIALVPVDLIDLKTPGKWLENLGSGQYHDGRAVIVLCENGEEIRQAQLMASTAMKHPQVMLGVPKEPVKLAILLRRHEALCNLEATQAHLYGVGADLREEWEQQASDFLAAIGRLLMPLLDPQKQLLDWFIDGQVSTGIRTKSQLTAAVSDMMRKAFPLTPRIAHERSSSDEGTDSPKRSRRHIIDTIFAPDGPTLLAKEPSAQEKTIIRAFYTDNNVLVARTGGGKHEIVRPTQATNPALHAVWGEIENAVDRAKLAPYDMLHLVDTLRASPYGMRIRAISLFVAAVVRHYVQRGNLSFEYVRNKNGPADRILKITGEVLDEAVLNADRYRLVFTDIGEKQDAIIFGVAKAMEIDTSPTIDRGELLTKIHSEIAAWWRALTAFARETRDLDKNTLVLREKVFRPLGRDDADIRSVLLEQLAEILQPTGDKQAISRNAVADLIQSAKATLDNAISTILAPKVDKLVVSVFGQSAATGANALKEWFTQLPEERRNLRVAGYSSVLSKKAMEAAKGATDSEVIVSSLVAEITGVPVCDWQDSMLERCRGMLEVTKKAVEEAEVQRISKTRGGDVVTIASPSPGQVSLTILLPDEQSFSRTFVPVKEISPMGVNLRNIIKGSIEGIGKKALPPGECETILIDVIRETLE